MVARAKFGNLGSGEFGFRCSRPGYDVNSATRGQLLYDTSDIVFQKVLSGETIIAQNQSSGNFDFTGPPLPAEYASYSNLHMWANFYFMTFSATTGALVLDEDLTFDEDGVNAVDFRYGVDTGVIKFSLINARATNWNSTFHYFIKSSWAVFNALMS